MKKIYISSSLRNNDDFLAFSLKRDLQEIGYEVINMKPNDSFYEESKTAPEYLISEADIFIGFLNEKNPIVFYELGYATALGKKVLIVSDSEYDLPPSLRNYNYIRSDYGISNSIYNIINFLEKTKIEEKRKNNNISNFKELILNLKDNPQIIDRISPFEFENFIYNYFINLGIRVYRPKNNLDYYYDFILEDWKGYEKTIIEVKKYNRNNKVSVNTIQQVLSTMNICNADHAIIITTSDFTSSAKEFANSITKNIELWDMNYLINNL